MRPSAAKVRALLAIFALRPNQPISSEALADRLWLGAPPATASSVLRTYVSQLRRLLPDGDTRLRRSGDGYWLTLDPEELDVSRFEALLAGAAGPAVAKGTAAALLGEALMLWRGPALLDLPDDQVAQAEAARLDELRCGAVESLSDVELDLGMHERVVARLEAAVRAAPLREQLVSRLMVALYRSGRQADALAAYQRLRRTLLDDLGLDPSSELRQLEADILTQDPSLDVRARRTGNLPLSLTSFVGRQVELQQLEALLAGERLVTVTGVGGCGKTRLALEAASAVPSLPDGAWFIDLSSKRHPVEVGRAVLSALGSEERADDATDAVRHALAERHILLLLDNCEHLARACAAFAAAVLSSCPGVTVLATSRAALDLPGEVIVAIAPLETPVPEATPTDVALAPAAALLAERVVAARGGRAVRRDEWPIIGELCRQVDGLPLAIELIAARADSLALVDLSAVVDDGVLTLERQAGEPDHHRSLVACVQWSLALLDDEDRRLLDRVCLLPATFSAAAAAAVAGRDDVLGGLARLASGSLLQASLEAPSRFRVLETVRHVVGPSVSREEAQTALDALVAWAASWAESVEPELRGPDAPRLLDDLELELEVLHAALDHGLDRADPSDGVRLAAAMSGLWAYRGHLVEGRERLERAVVASAKVEMPLRVRVLLAAGTHLVTFGDVEGFRAHVEAALSLARATAGGTDMFRTLLWAGHAVRLGGEPDTAAALYLEALATSRAIGDESSAASALAGLGDVAATRDDLDAALALHLESLAAFRAAGDAHGEGQALLNVAEIDRRARSFEDADAGFAAAAAVFTTIADRSCIAAAAEGRARVAFDGDRLVDAEVHYRDAIRSRRELRQDHRAAEDLAALATVLAAAERPDEAAAALGAAGDDSHPLAGLLRRQLGDRRYLTAWAEGSIDRTRSRR